MPFLSSYLETAGSPQTVATGGDIAFTVTPEDIDIVGAAVQIDSTGKIFTITQPGLYHVEWSINLSSATAPVLIGLLENGEASSATSHAGTMGHVSSGALINVEKVPYTISLHNFGGQLVLANAATPANTAASIRILRFADGPTQMM